MPKLAKSLAIAGCAAVAGCAAPPPPYAAIAQSSARQCFRADQVYGYQQGPYGTVDVQTASGPFRLHMGPGCPDFSWIMQIGVRPVESSWLCAGHPDQIITAYETQFSRCWVSEIEPLGRPNAGLSQAQAASGAGTNERLRLSAAAIPPSANAAPATLSTVQR
ncbi:MAG TPA: DUF6491 family protein [Sphingomicrobium sp.]